MNNCEFCDKSFDSERELHIHWGEEHEEDLNSHQKEKSKKARREKEEERDRKKTNRRNLFLKGLTGISILIFAVLVLPQILAMFKSGPMDLDSQPVQGDDNSSVKIVEFGDYQCGHCQSFDREVHPRLKENFIDTGKANFYFINNPILGEGSVAAARASEYVYLNDPENYWEFHHALFQNIGSESISGLMNRTTNINTSNLNQKLNSEEVKEAVKKDREISQSNGVRSTPTVYVNGERVEPTYQSIKDAVEKNLQDGS